MTHTLTRTAVLLTALAQWIPHASAQSSSSQSSTSKPLNTLDSSFPAEEALQKDIHPKDVIHWSVGGAEHEAKTGQVTATVALSTSHQFTIYTDKLDWLAPSGWTVAKVVPPKTSRQLDPISNKEVDVYTGGEFRVTLSGPTGAVESPLPLHVKYVGCTQVICLFPWTESLALSLVPASAANALAETMPPMTPAPATMSAPLGTSEPNPTSSFEEQFAQKVKEGSLGLGMMLLIAFIGGLLTNLTPCVAPMIPITIRLLGNQTSRPLFGSSMYALGIVVTYTILGVIAAMSGALFGNLIAHPAVAISFGIIMAVLGLSMLGFGDLSKLQQLGGRLGSGRGGPMNAFLMGTGAGLVASPCTGPILAALLTYTAGRSSISEATALLCIYSIGFALPYVFLGASAAKISKVRVNFALQIATKLVFAGVMFGLSLYFLRLPLYALFTKLQHAWGWISVVGLGLSAVSTIVIIGSSSLEHNKKAMLVPSVLLGVGIFFGVQYLTRSGSSAHDSVTWYRTESEAFAVSTKANKPILVDAWAEWCEACKKMDVTTFADPKVLEELETHWVLYKMDLTEPTDPNNALQEKYELPGLPTITLLPAGGDLARKKALSGYVGAESMLESLQSFRKSLP